MSNDLELLRRYAAGESQGEEAFAELVRRHLNLVFSAALRMLGNDAHRAEDVSQMVFANLARHAGDIPSATILAGWLHRDACFKALEVLRGERRLRTREEIAMNETPRDPDIDWGQLRPELDQSLNQLRECDRDALLLRFFEGLSLAELGQRLGVGESRASRRVSNALNKPRGVLRRRGITTTASALASVLAVQGVSAAPANLAGVITAQSLALIPAASTVAAGLGSSTITSSTSTLLLAMKTKWIVLGGIAAVILGSVSFVAFRHIVQEGPQPANGEQRVAVSRLEVSRNEQRQHIQPAMPILTQLITYAGDHDGQLPSSLMVAGTGDDRFELIPVTIKVPNSQSTLPGPILREKESWIAANGKRSRVYGFADGHAVVLSQGDAGFEP